MYSAIYVCSLFVTIVCGGKTLGEFDSFPVKYLVRQRLQVDLSNSTELVVAIVIFRHGDRTPDQEELDLYPEVDNKNILFPFGAKALTNKGKQRSYRIGKYLRRRYDKLVNQLYLPEEIALWSTEYDRTKMTALAAMAGMYPPPPAQRWNPSLDWQPVTYKTIPYDDDDLLYWYNCPRYLSLRDKVYEQPEVKASIQTYNELFEYLSNRTSTDIDTPEDVFYLSNLFQALESIKIQAPKWVRRRSKEINDVTKLEYSIENYNPELIRLASGVLMNEIRNVMSQFVHGREDGRKLRMYSAHENNVAALMAAVGVFEPHQPPYGSTFSLELRRGVTGEYSVMAVYTVDPLIVDERVLEMSGCNGQLLCPFDMFLNITSVYSWTKEQWKQACPITNP
ncbi:hypothetical protein O0L34_g3970 [Tuta absoluta]|nr:hypothetical protein O0L34_g3970 [Tuta absoluta]